jgi:hypothetical protein
VSRAKAGLAERVKRNFCRLSDLKEADLADAERVNKSGPRTNRNL